MPYPYEQIFAGDPASPEKVASNGVVTIFAPGDPNRTPLTITTLDGLPLPNPIQVNESGHGSAFLHATLDQVAWEGGGLSGLFVSYQGMKDVAVAARVAAETAAQNAGAPTDESVDRGIQRADIPGKVADQIANGPVMSGVVADYAATPGNPLNKTLNAAYATNTVLATQERFLGIDPTGMTNSSPGLQAAALATPDGGTLVIPKGTYLCDGTAIDLTGPNAKNLTISMYGAEFIKSADKAVFNFDGTFEARFDVSAVAATATTDDTTGLNPATALTIPVGAPAWTKGDVVKVIADDVIPGGRPGVDGLQARIGEYLIVSNVVGDVVTCIGTLRESYKTNVRVARLRNMAVHLRGGRFRTTAVGLAETWTSNMIQFAAMVGPSIVDTTVASTPCSGFRFSGCYGYTVIGAEVEYAKNAVGNNGYGIQDSSSAFGRISNYRARRVRHAFTDGTAFIAAGTTDPRNYGGTYGTQISNSVAYGTANTAWDTHSWSENVTFSDCQAIDCYKGFNLRGRKHRVIDCSATRCFTGGVYIFVENAGGDSWGHYVKDFFADDVPTRALEISLNPLGHPNAGAREARMSYVDGFFIRGGGPESVYIRNASARLDNIHFIAAPAQTSDTSLFFVRNATAEGGNWVQDLRQVSNGTGIELLHIESGGTVDIGTWDYMTTSGSAPRITYAVKTDSAMVQASVRKLTMSHPPATLVTTTLGEGSRFDWEYLSTGETSAYFSAIDGAISSMGGAVATISRSKAPIIFARLNATAGPQAMPAFRGGAFRGQIVHIWNVSTAQPVTVPHGSATYKTFLSSGADVVLAPNQKIQMVWIGTAWWQI